MPTALIVYASTHGHTRRIVEQLAVALEADGLRADLCDVATDTPPDLRDHALVLVGGSVHAGHHQRELADWAEHHHIQLDQVPSAFFSVCLAAAEDDEESRQAVQGYLDDFEERTGWTPRARTTFAGALQYREYSYPVRLAMRLMMSRGGHPTDTSRDYDYTDWGAVEAWAHECAALAGTMTLKR